MWTSGAMDDVMTTSIHFFVKGYALFVDQYPLFVEQYPLFLKQLNSGAPVWYDYLFELCVRLLVVERVITV
jgi:hypothetical protein